MTVTIEPEWEALIARKVSTGEYPSADTLISEAIRRFFSETGGREILPPGMNVEVWSPHEAYGAAAQLSDFLQREKEARK